MTGLFFVVATTLDNSFLPDCIANCHGVFVTTDITVRCSQCVCHTFSKCLFTKRSTLIINWKTPLLERVVSQISRCYYIEVTGCVYDISILPCLFFDSVVFGMFWL